MSYSNRVYLHGYCNSFIHYFNIIFVQYKNTFFALFFLSSHWAIPTPLRSQLPSSCFILELRSQKIPLVFLFPYLIYPFIHKFPDHSQENKLRSRQIPSRADGVRGRDSEARMERMAAAVARRWRCCEASILLKLEVSISLWFVSC